MIPEETDDARSELRVLAKLSAPIALAQLGLMSMGLVDTAILGGVSVKDLAGSAIGRSIVFTVSALGLGMSAALEPLASQAVGANAPERAWAALSASTRAGLIFAVPCVAVVWALTYLLVPIGVDANLVPVVRAYCLGLAPGLVAFTLFFGHKAFLQAHGETRPALVASAVANVVNLVACFLLIRGDDALAWLHLPRIGLPSLGALGAGLATSIADAVLLGIVVVAARKHRPSQPGAPVAVATVVRLGLPVGLQLMAEIGVFSLVALLAGRLGAEVVAAHQIAIGMASFTFMGALGVAGATATRVGHAIGAGRSPRRAGVLGIGLGAAVMGFGALVFASVPRALTRIFTPDEGVITIGAHLLAIAALFQLFDGMQAVAAGALRGAGDVRFAFGATVSAHWFLGLPTALFLGFGLNMGAPGLWWGLTVGLVMAAIFLTCRFLQIAKGTLAPVDTPYVDVSALPEAQPRR